MFPFSYEPKSMRIMVRLHDKIFYYLKGAYTVMQSKITQSDGHFMAEACLDLANEK
jgi:gluconate kinase